MSLRSLPQLEVRTQATEGQATLGPGVIADGTFQLPTSAPGESNWNFHVHKMGPAAPYDAISWRRVGARGSSIGHGLAALTVCRRATTHYNRHRHRLGECLANCADVRRDVRPAGDGNNGRSPRAARARRMADRPEHRSRCGPYRASTGTVVSSLCSRSAGRTCGLISR